MIDGVGVGVGFGVDSSGAARLASSLEEGEREAGVEEKRA